MQKRLKNKQKRQNLKQLKKQKLKLAKTGKNRGDKKTANKSVKWNNRRLKIIERMRARKAKLDMKKEQDAFRKANKQRQKEKTEIQNALFKKEHSLTNKFKIFSTTKEGRHKLNDTPMKSSTIFDKITENELNAVTNKERLSSNVINTTRITDKINLLNETSIADANMKNGTGINENNGISLSKNDENGISNVGSTKPVVSGFTINELPVLDLTSVIDPRTQMNTFGIEPGFPADPLKSENVGPGIPLGMANIGDSLWEPFDQNIGLSNRQSSSDNEVLTGNIDANMGIPLGPIETGMNAPFNPIDVGQDLPSKQTGRLKIPLEKINIGNIILLEQHGIANESTNNDHTNFNSDSQLNHVEKLPNSAFDINGNGFPLSPVTKFTELKEDKPNPHIKNGSHMGQTSTNLLSDQNSNTMGEILRNVTTDLTIHANKPNSPSIETINSTITSNQFEILNNANQSDSSTNETGTPGSTPKINAIGEPLGPVDINQQNNTVESGFNPVFSEFGEAAVFQSVDLNQFFSNGNRNDLDGNSPLSIQTPEPTQDNGGSISGIMTLNGEIMPIAGQPMAERPSSNVPFVSPNTATSKSTLPKSSLLGVLFEIQRSLRQGKTD
ncbi:MATH and LRR domain-containing protein PFE0570w-like [Ruditapes philippinarum]|uniref:MATH and LRR domain-containing protein PFE0570w-like n=1 Tax=Ruditapes philippinarum TaxID=129788 RepID=UPI00295A99A9|nr:MATH and LRR domain-containing protein PFE0570w-like [Ruditapes philippinarum]